MYKSTVLSWFLISRQYCIFPIKRTVFFSTIKVLKHMLRLIENILLPNNLSYQYGYFLIRSFCLGIDFFTINIYKSQLGTEIPKYFLVHKYIRLFGYSRLLNLAYSDNCYFHLFLSVVWLSWNFARFHEI